MKKFLIIVLLTLSFTSAACSQNAPTKSSVVMAKTARTFDSVLSETAYEIKEKQSQVSTAILQKDMEVIKESLPSIKDSLKPEFNDEEIEEAVLYGWQAMREKQLKPDAALTTKLFIEYVVDLGMIIISSVPTGASVEFNGEDIKSKTNVRGWTSSGDLKLRIRKSGYKDYVRTVKVKKVGRTYVTAQLSKK